jgi:hypothetical protein
MNQFHSMAQLISQLLVVIAREEGRQEGREPTW